MSLANIIAARKAAALADKQAEDTIVLQIPPEIEAKMESPIKEEPIIPAGKPLSFAEKLALKKQSSISTASTPAATNNATVLPTLTGHLDDTVRAPEVPVIPVSMQEKLKAAIKTEVAKNSDPDTEEFENAPEEIKQGYRSIVGKVAELSGTDDNDLADAMSSLKKALLSNPSACMLMLDEDIGKMTIALRRLTQEALVESTKEKVSKPRAKKSTSNAVLTEEQMQKVFEEL